MTTSASETLRQLHKDLYLVLSSVIRNGVPVQDQETGKVTYKEPSARLLNIARQFMRDNKATAKSLEDYYGV